MRTGITRATPIATFSSLDVCVGRGSSASFGRPWGAQATNLVAQAGGFGVIALDLAGLPQRKLREWQRRSWVRLQRAVEHSPTALIVLAEQRLVGSTAALALELTRERVHWRRSTTLLLDGIETKVRVVRRNAIQKREERLSA